MEYLESELEHRVWSITTSKYKLFSHLSYDAAKFILFERLQRMQGILNPTVGVFVITTNEVASKLPQCQLSHLKPNVLKNANIS